MKKGVLSKEFLLVALVIIIGIMIIFMFIKPFNDGSGRRDAELFANYGTFIGGVLGTIVGLISVYLIYLTYNRQSIAQNTFFKTERFENRLFEMIRFNRDIVNNMEYEVPDEYIKTDPAKKELKDNFSSIVVSGQKVFVQIHKHIRSALAETRWVFRDINSWEDIILQEKLVEAKRNYSSYYDSKKDPPPPLSIHQYNIIYLAVFFGMSEDGISMFKTTAGKKYTSFILEDVIVALRAKPTKWSGNWGLYKVLTRNPTEKPDFDAEYFSVNYDKFYGGHHHRLGHYFRHLKSIYDHINQTAEFSFRQKYKYARMLRAQLSAYEQSIFFYNSFSELGSSWEITAKKAEEFTDFSLEDFQLITKFDIIKNISKEFVGSEIELERFYPGCLFGEGDTDFEKKKRYH